MAALVLVSLIAGFIGGVVAFGICEAYYSRKADNVVVDTEFYPDQTTHDVPEMAPAPPVAPGLGYPAIREYWTTGPGSKKPSDDCDYDDDPRRGVIW